MASWTRRAKGHHPSCVLCVLEASETNPSSGPDDNNLCRRDGPPSRSLVHCAPDHHQPSPHRAGAAWARGPAGGGQGRSTLHCSCSVLHRSVISRIIYESSRRHLSYPQGLSLLFPCLFFSRSLFGVSRARYIRSSRRDTMQQLQIKGASTDGRISMHIYVVVYSYTTHRTD